MQSESIKLAGINLRGRWHHGKSYEQLIIICHGFNSSNKNPTLVAITDGLNKQGYDTFTFDFSENTGGFDIEHQVNDIKQIASHFKDYKELVLLAASFAALTAAIATNQLPSISRLITLNGFFGEGKLGQEHRKSYIKFRVAALLIPQYRMIFKYYKRELKPNLTEVPVLVIHSKVDKYVSIKQSKNFYKQINSPKRFIRLDEADHGITSPEDRLRVVAEIDKWLKPTKKA